MPTQIILWIFAIFERNNHTRAALLTTRSENGCCCLCGFILFFITNIRQNVNEMAT